MRTLQSGIKLLPQNTNIDFQHLPITSNNIIVHPHPAADGTKSGTKSMVWYTILAVIQDA